MEIKEGRTGKREHFASRGEERKAGRERRESRAHHIETQQEERGHWKRARHQERHKDTLTTARLWFRWDVK
ncbi:hypothetical protein JOQ06_014616, partial [Pogonophryne albipinna]